ncbi:hypothetical protein [Lacisediminihabitans sp. H27-G8]|uniref:hypothetical protein n=1 Tax=Lacisediminihabitans sp. H27-G8 TaxID=3111909 RepID=UPI0038FC2CB8
MPVTILSSLPQPEAWLGEWIQLPTDTDVHPIEATANGAFHWVPLESVGLSSRMSAISSWLGAARPEVVVVDVSVEIAALVRLHGIRVVTFAQPGDRTDEAHTLGYRLASAIIAPWPSDLRPSAVLAPLESEFQHVGAISRIQVEAAVSTDVVRRPNRIAVMNGSGGRGISALDMVVEEAQAAMPDAEWVRLDGEPVNTVEHNLREASVVFAHCGQNALAEIAACRTPAILVAEDRPHNEQHSMAASLRVSELPVIVLTPGDGVDRRAAIATAQLLDGEGWAQFVDGDAARRTATVITNVAGASHLPSHRRAV